MRAAWYERYGSAEDVLVVGQQPDPVAGPGEVLVRVRTSGINPSDVKRRAVDLGGFGGKFTRIIPHSDGSGIIEAVGAGVDKGRVGERVWTWNAQWQRPFGTAAEFVSLPLEQAVRLPDPFSFEDGACLGIPAQAAHRAVFADGPVTDCTILVTGGAGVVGRLAIQLAKWGGARVITTVSGPEKAAHAKAAGADVVLDYKREDVVAAVMDLTKGVGVDRIIDVELGGNLAVTCQVLRANGVVVAYGSVAEPNPVLPFYPMMFKALTIRLVVVYLLPANARRQAIADLTTVLEGKALRLDVGKVLPLEQIAAGHDLVERSACIGKVMLRL
jgi:NADPH:quinone reductase